MKEKIVFLVGPTAVGKTEIAMLVAEKLNAEIVSLDSMQVYKGMDILSSKSAHSLRKKVRHHLIDIVSSTSNYNVSRYREDAAKEMKKILKKRKVPLFVGGTGLYFKVLLDGIFTADTEDRKVRNRLYREAQKSGSIGLYAALRKVDPAAALKIHPNDLRRIVRALEVYKKTGIPISEWQREAKGGIAQDYDVRIFGLKRPKEELRSRIDLRLDKMFKRGIVPEVKRLTARGLSKTARQALGIREISGYLNKEYDLSQARELLRRNTYRYVKKQLTWFKKDRRINWIEVKKKQNPKEVADKIYRMVS